MRRLVPLLLAALAACAGPGRQSPAAPPPSSSAAAPERSTPPLAGPPPALVLPAQEHFQLGNGLKVRLVEYHRLPIVAVQLVVGAGAAQDPSERPGLASFTAAMLTEGTRTRTATQISDEVGFLGAHLGAGAGFDAASVSGACLSRHLPRLLDLLADVTLHPTFPASDFARVQDQRMVALIQQRDSPGAVASKAFAPLFWGGHPYGHSVMGTEASVAAMGREDLARFHADHYRPENSELVVVGDVSPAELKRELERAFGGWSAAARPAAPFPQAAAAGLRSVIIEKPGAPQTFLLLGMPGIARSSPDFAAVQVALRVLGGGSSSRLFRNLREKEGYTYGISAREDSRRLGGASIVGGSVRADATGRALKAILAEVETMRRDPVPPGELEDAKKSIVLSLPSNFSTAAGIAGMLAEEVLAGLPDDYWTRYAAEVMAVTPADVQRVSQRILDPARLVTVMVGDAPVVKPQLADLPLGPLEVRPSPATAQPVSPRH